MAILSGVIIALTVAVICVFVSVSVSDKREF